MSERHVVNEGRPQQCQQGTTLLVGVDTGTFSGIDTYAEQMTLAAAAGHDVTLLATGADTAANCARGRAMRASMSLPWALRIHRLDKRCWSARARRCRSIAWVRRSPRRSPCGRQWHASQLAQPALAPFVEPYVQRVCKQTSRETWLHSRRELLLRRLALVSKSFDHYRLDRRGFA